MRALRTPEFVYVRNFAPDRWPMGSPGGAASPTLPSPETLENETYAAYADMDASPTKAWLIAHRNDPQWKWHYDFAFGKRPAEELYDVRQDPDQIHNLASDPAYSQQKQQLSDRLLKLLRDAGDPRIIGDGRTFDSPPFSDPVPAASKKKKAKAK
jgi:uncharacterized sulfatase